MTTKWQSKACVIRDLNRHDHDKQYRTRQGMANIMGENMGVIVLNILTINENF